jgi:hypothetical protein
MKPDAPNQEIGSPPRGDERKRVQTLSTLVPLPGGPAGRNADSVNRLSCPRDERVTARHSLNRSSPRKRGPKTVQRRRGGKIFWCNAQRLLLNLNRCEQGCAAQAVCSLPRLRGRVGEGALLNSEFAAAPSLALPQRKGVYARLRRAMRGRGRCRAAAATTRFSESLLYFNRAAASCTMLRSVYFCTSSAERMKPSSRVASTFACSAFMSGARLPLRA